MHIEQFAVQMVTFLLETMAGFKTKSLGKNVIVLFSKILCSQILDINLYFNDTGCQIRMAGQTYLF